ncbi:MAG: hypothetical protein J6R77_02175 [Clostridia bacterium]|nr:hypothetical protein [Clostridia bacterium]
MRITKSKRWSLWVAAAALAAVLVYVIGFWIGEAYTYYRSGMWEWEVKDFRNNKPHFERLAHTLYPYFEKEYEHNTHLQSIQILPVGDEWELRYTYTEQEKPKTELISMSEDERESLEKVQNALHHEQTGLYYIHIHAGRVTFANTYGYAVIWSQNGERPAFLFSADETGDFVSNRLSVFSNKWYQGIRQ